MSEIKTIPILFSTPMVQAILDNKKTQTRRVIKPQPNENATEIVSSKQWKNGDYVARFKIQYADNKGQPEAFEVTNLYKCKYKVGDILWVRETWQHECELIQLAGGNWSNAYLNATGNYIYKADGIILNYVESIAFSKWKPSIFMPKSACRIFLEVINIKVERLHDISEDDCIAEGIKFLDIAEPYTFGYKLYGRHGISDLLGRKAVTGTAYESYQTLWADINGTDSWENNPYVFAIEFKRTDKPKNFII